MLNKYTIKKLDSIIKESKKDIYSIDFLKIRNNSQERFFISSPYYIIELKNPDLIIYLINRVNFLDITNSIDSGTINATKNYFDLWIQNPCFNYDCRIALNYKEFDFNLKTACDNAAKLCSQIIKRY